MLEFIDHCMTVTRFSFKKKGGNPASIQGTTDSLQESNKLAKNQDFMPQRKNLLQVFTQQINLRRADRVISLINQSRIQRQLTKAGKRSQNLESLTSVIFQFKMKKTCTLAGQVAIINLSLFATERHGKKGFNALRQFGRDLFLRSPENKRSNQ